MLKLIIGNKVYSSWSLRGWLAVRQSGLPFNEVVVSMYDEDWPERRMQPDIRPSGGKVPILWDGDHPVWDSLALIDYLNDISGGTKFWPSDRPARAMARSIAAEMHSSFMALRRQHPMNTGHVYAPAPLDPEVEQDVARITQLWRDARDVFGSEGPFLFGEFGAADIMFAPVITRFATYSIPVPDDACAYMDAVLAHPFMQDWAKGAREEEWIIPRFERTEQGA